MLDIHTKIDKKKRILLFIDYDGTLAPIVDDPDRAFLSDDTREVLVKISEKFTTSIVTGRSLNTISNFLHPLPPLLSLATCHGHEIAMPNTRTHMVGEHLVDQLQAVKRLLVAHVLPDGALLEDNKYCLSIHYRRLSDEERKALDQRVNEVLDGYDGIRRTYGHLVYELRVDAGWDKGEAVKWILKHNGVSENSDHCMPIYLGDDITDEDGFEAVKKYKHGLGIIVGSREPSVAHARLSSPSDVRDFLRVLL